MAVWFWYFIIYSLIGFVLEVLFARVTRQPKRDRKCLYFLPLCPVYGFGALLILALPAAVRERPWLLFLLGALAATLAEYLLGLFYQKAARVVFWDYSDLPLNIGGHVCLLFTALWGLLSLALVYGVHPWVVRLAAALPGWLFIPVLLFFALDVGFTLHVLRREQTTEALRWYRRIGRGGLGQHD